MDLDVAIMKGNLKQELILVENAVLSGTYNDGLMRIVVSYKGGRYQLHGDLLGGYYIVIDWF